MAHRLRWRPAPDVTEPPTNTIEEIPPNEAADRNEDDIPAQTVERRRMTVDISASAVAKIVVGLHPRRSRRPPLRVR